MAHHVWVLNTFTVAVAYSNVAQAGRMISVNAESAHDSAMILQLMDVVGMLDRQIIAEMSGLARSTEAHHKASAGKCCKHGIEPAPRTEIKQNIKPLSAKQSKRSERIEDGKPDYVVDMIHHARNVVVAGS